MEVGGVLTVEHKYYNVDDTFAMGLKSRCRKLYDEPEPACSLQQPTGVAVVRESVILSRLGSRNVDITVGFRSRRINIVRCYV